MSTLSRYPGSRSFQDTDVDRLLFYGREHEKGALLHLVLAQDLVLFYAKSGTGKTSLLNAGYSSRSGTRTISRSCCV